MDIVFSSTAQLAGAIRAGDVSVVEVLEAHLAQIEKHNPALNAVVTLDAERARARAREADAALARGEVRGPLHGVPFTLKDAHATAGMRTTTGFPPLADHVPQEDSIVTARLKAAGGFLIGKTSRPTMLADFQTNNPILRNGIAAAPRWAGRNLLDGQRPQHTVQLHRPPGSRAAVYAGSGWLTDRSTTSGETLGRIAAAGNCKSATGSNRRIPPPVGLWYCALNDFTAPEQQKRERQ